MKFISAFFITTLLFVGCKTSNRSAKYRQQGYIEGVVKDDRKIAGCSFSILLDGEKLITPQNLDEKFKKDNLKVWIKYEPLQKQPITNCMRGQVVVITDIVLQ